MRILLKKLALSSFSVGAVAVLGIVAGTMNGCTITTTNDDGDAGDLGDSGIIDTDGDVLADGAIAATLPFQPSNFLLSAVDTTQIGAQDVSTSCTIQTDEGAANDCFESNPIADGVVLLSNGAKAHLIVASSITVEPTAHISVSGGLPLILVSIGDFKLLGTIDAHAEGTTSGPGGFSTTGTNAAGGGPGGGAAGVGSGGVAGVAAGGGSYCGVGGVGGVENGGGTAGVAAPVNGTADLRPLAGGSSGGVGDVGGGGGGGGGIQLVSGGVFTLAQGAYVNVGGGGGTFGGTTGQNAGGGGAGGSILIEATTVSLAGVLAANGGGGGAGGGGSAGAGGDATPNSTPAAGGTNTGAPQSAGGAGGAASGPNGLGGGDLSGSSAGGGGGGAGRIRINTLAGTVTWGTAVVSPAPGALDDGGIDVDGGSASCTTVGTLRTSGSGI